MDMYTLPFRKTLRRKRGEGNAAIMRGVAGSTMGTIVPICKNRV